MATPLPPVEGVARTILKGLVADKTWEIVQHWGIGGGTMTAGFVSALAEAVYTSFADTLLDYLNPQNSIEAVEATDLSSDMGVQETIELSTSGASGGSGDIASSSAVVVSKGIDLRYRGGHPRTYLAIGMGSDLTSTSEWTSGFVADIDSDWGNYVDNIIGISVGGNTVDAEVMVSYVNKALNPIKPYYRATPLVLVTTGFQVNPGVCSQRRRNGKR